MCADYYPNLRLSDTFCDRIKKQPYQFIQRRRLSEVSSWNVKHTGQNQKQMQGDEKMNQVMDKLHDSSLYKLYNSFSPASRAAILFAVPFTIVDAIHYFTAGTALIFSFPILILIYLYCGSVAARIAYPSEQDASNLPRIGRSSALRLWLTSTVINTLLMIILGFASLGITLLSGVFYLCLFVPFHVLGSALSGWVGGWLYQQYIHRIGVK